MTVQVHKPYPGVRLVVTPKGSILFGAPADAFKATKAYCSKHDLSFPRVLVAPQTLLVDANPQFNPEFFLYDFLFVYGAAFKPDLQEERLVFVLDPQQDPPTRKALHFTLAGPSKSDLEGYRTDAAGTFSAQDASRLAAIGAHMAIKKGDAPRTLEDMVSTVAFDARGVAHILDGTVKIERTGPQSFALQCSEGEAQIDLKFYDRVIPFATLPSPRVPQTPITFGVKALGTRSGFDLSGPTTGFVIWVNGRAVIYDGPVGTRYLLEKEGISGDDIEGVILSHCHEDHMGAFVELILAGYRPRVYTTEPIYRSALVKLASYFQKSEAEVATFVDYTPVDPTKPIEILGAQFRLFYTVHSIPTVGIEATLRDAFGVVHRAQISGDTMHHEGLDGMLDLGIIDGDTHQSMRNLIPNERQPNSLYFADVGEAIIHGHPKDWQGNPNEVLYYHCPDNEHTASFGHRLASPGGLYVMAEPRKVHPAVPGRLLKALKALDIRDPGWFATIMYQGQTRRVQKDTSLVSVGEKSGRGDTFSVIVSGIASVRTQDGDVLAHLNPGEFFGAIELVGQEGRAQAEVHADTPMEIFDVAADVFHAYVRQAGIEETLEKIWTQRPLVESAKIFRGLDLHIRNRIAKTATRECYAQGDTIIEEGAHNDDFFVLLSGKVSISSKSELKAELNAEQQDNFFGEISAIHPDRPRGASVCAKTDAEILRLRGEHIRKLFAGHMGVRYAIEIAVAERS